MLNYSNKKFIQYKLLKSYELINLYEWLLDYYVVDFYVNNQWDTLPKSWQQCFENIDLKDLGFILNGKQTTNLLPLSFLCLLKTIETLSVCRQQENIQTKTKRGHPAWINHPKLKNLFLKNVKLKKRHEIELMADLVANVASESGCDSVVDFGSGLGHLVRVLSYKYGIRTVGIESQGQLSEEARKLDRNLEYTLKKFLPDTQIEQLTSYSPEHVNMTLESHIQLDNLPLPMGNFGLIGLHPCGDLGPLLLKHFTNSSRVKFISIVSCCYMKLTCVDGDICYPLSKFVSGLKHKLSYPSREIACHAIEVYAERLMEGKYENLKIHAYRAALERILVGINPDLQHSPVRSIKHTDSMTFEKEITSRYCALAFERLDIPIPTDPEVWLRAEQDLKRWRHVVILYTIRLILAPIVETVVLLDRLMYLIENDMSCELVPVFDPVLSPRNHVIIARKNV